MTSGNPEEQIAASGSKAHARPLEPAKYARLRTFRQDGSPVDCPVWFAVCGEGSTVWFRSKRETPKVRRLVANPAVTLRASDWRGKPLSKDQTVWSGNARIIDEASDEWARAEAALAKRYGWQWNSVPLFRLPLTGTVKTDMSFAAKIRHIRSGAPLPGSCLIAVDLGQCA